MSKRFNNLSTCLMIPIFIAGFVCGNIVMYFKSGYHFAELIYTMEGEL